MENMDASRSDEESSGDGMECEKLNDGGDLCEEIYNDEEGEVSGADGYDDCGVHKEDGGNEEATVTMEQRLDAIDAKLAELNVGMSLFGERLTELVAVTNHQIEGSHGKRDVVTSLMFETYVDEAISNGHSLGVSRSFIQEFITKTFSLPCNKYLQRRIGQTLRRKVNEKCYKLENNLYSFYQLQSEKIKP